MSETWDGIASRLATTPAGSDDAVRAAEVGAAPAASEGPGFRGAVFCVDEAGSLIWATPAALGVLRDLGQLEWADTRRICLAATRAIWLSRSDRHRAWPLPGNALGCTGRVLAPTGQPTRLMVHLWRPAVAPAAATGIWQDLLDALAGTTT